MNANDQMGFADHLAIAIDRAPRHHGAKTVVRVPGKGRLMWTTDPGSAGLFGEQFFSTNLLADHFDGDGKLIGQYDLGSGTVTNVGVDTIVNDVLGWALNSSLKLFNNHGTGTGVTASAATDYWLQTAIASGSLTGSTNGYFTGAQSVVAPNTYKSVATVVYNATLAVTEWVLTLSNAANLALSTTATAANSATYASGLTTTGNGNMGWVIESNATAINTPTTTVISTPITTNTSTVATLGVTTAGGWTTLANGVPSGTGPGAVATVIYPATLDHLVFSAINVNASDSIQFSFSLAINSGG
jgi:hypothetical protein